MRKSRPSRSPAVAEPLDLADDEVAPLYLAMLEIPHPSRDALLAQGFSTDQLNRLLPVLERRGMIQQVDPDNWSVIPPDIAIPAFAAELETRARLIRGTAQALSRLYLHARSADRTDATSGAILLESVADLLQALHQVTTTAQEWVLTSRIDSPLTRYLLAGPRPASTARFRSSTGEPLDFRIDVDPVLLPEPAVLDLMRGRVEAGDAIRLTAGLPFTGAVNDQGLAMVDLGDDGGSPVGILLNRAAGGARVHAALEFAWQLGTPWRPSHEPASESDQLDARDRSILRLMAGGVSDAAIARQLGVSSRTVERRVRTLLERLNATTRFQAGVLAARHGLI